MHLPLILIATFFGQSLSHSWNEQLTVIENGRFSGRNGYPRGYVARTDRGFRDPMMVHLLPPSTSNRTRIDSTDLLCAYTQRTKNQTATYPRLQASPGSYIAIKYLENGHVTLPQPGKQSGAGIVYVFGTLSPEEKETITNVLQWTADGKGGDGRGKLLAAQNFDDGRCYQLNNESISLSRQKEFPNLITRTGEVHEQWCENDVIIPSDIPLGSTYTIYWVWDWPTVTEDQAQTRRKDEYYTTCSDIDVVANPAAGPPNPLDQQDPQTAAVANFQQRAACGQNLRNGKNLFLHTQ